MISRTRAIVSCLKTNWTDIHISVFSVNMWEWSKPADGTFSCIGSICMQRTVVRARGAIRLVQIDKLVAFLPNAIICHYSGTWRLAFWQLSVRCYGHAGWQDPCCWLRMPKSVSCRQLHTLIPVTVVVRIKTWCVVMRHIRYIRRRILHSHRRSPTHQPLYLQDKPLLDDAWCMVISQLWCMHGRLLPGALGEVWQYNEWNEIIKLSLACMSVKYTCSCR